MGAFLLIVIIVGIIGYFTCSKEARVMRDVNRMIDRNAEELKKRYGINKQLSGNNLVAFLMSGGN